MVLFYINFRSIVYLSYNQLYSKIFVRFPVTNQHQEIKKRGLTFNGQPSLRVGKFTCFVTKVLLFFEPQDPKIQSELPTFEAELPTIS